jgi:hypothetical protein
MPIQGLKGQPSNRKPRFRHGEEEEVHLIDFFTEIKEFTEPSATRFVLEKTGEQLTRNDDAELVAVETVSTIRRLAWLECCNQQHRSCQYYPPGQ